MGWRKKWSRKYVVSLFMVINRRWRQFCAMALEKNQRGRLIGQAQFLFEVIHCASFFVFCSSINTRCKN